MTADLFSSTSFPEFQAFPGFSSSSDGLGFDLADITPTACFDIPGFNVYAFQAPALPPPVSSFPIVDIPCRTSPVGTFQPTSPDPIPTSPHFFMPKVEPQQGFCIRTPSPSLQSPSVSPVQGVHSVSLHTSPNLPVKQQPVSPNLHFQRSPPTHYLPQHPPPPYTNSCTAEYIPYSPPTRLAPPTYRPHPYPTAHSNPSVRTNPSARANLYSLPLEDLVSSIAVPDADNTISVSLHNPAPSVTSTGYTYTDYSALNSRSGPLRPDKRNRTKFSPEQLEFLERGFAEGEFAVAERKEHIARECGVPPRTIALWFQNRRAKRKRERKRTSPAADVL